MTIILKTRYICGNIEIRLFYHPGITTVSKPIYKLYVHVIKPIIINKMTLDKHFNIFKNSVCYKLFCDTLLRFLYLFREF